MDEVGDREPNYWVLRYDPEMDQMDYYMTLYMTRPQNEVRL
jgi:hypothetical protein